MSRHAGTSVADVITTAAEFASLEADWAALSRPFEHPLLEHDWFLAAARTLYKDGDLRVVVVREAGVLAAAAPLVICKRPDGRLSVIGATTIHEPADWLYGSGTALHQLAVRVLALGRITMLPRVPFALAEHLARLPHRRGIAVVRPALPSLWVDAGGLDWDGYLARLPSHGRRAIREMDRRLRRATLPVTTERLRPRPEEIPPLLDEFVRIEASSWKGRVRSALACRPDHRAFYLTYLEGAARQGRARISTLSIGSDRVAMELAIEAYGRLWSLKTGYNQRFADTAPGLLLAHESIHAAFDEGLRGYELLGAAEAWQRRWNPARHEYRAVTLYPCSVSGLVGLGADAVQYLGRRVASRRSAWRRPASGPALPANSA